MFKKFAAELYDFFFRKVANYLSLLFIIVVLFAVLFKNSCELITSPGLISYVLIGMSTLTIISAVFYFFYYFVLYGKVFMYLGGINYSLTETQNLINKNPGANSTLEEAKKYYTDTETIEKLEEINNICAYESFSMINSDFGLILIPILGLLGLIPVFGQTDFISITCMKYLSVACLISLGYKYYYSFLSSCLSERVSENYNNILIYYQKNAKE